MTVSRRFTPVYQVINRTGILDSRFTRHATQALTASGAVKPISTITGTDPLMTPFNLTTAHPAIPKENILLVEGIQDLVTPAEPIEELWQLWGQPDIWRLPHGHISLSLCLGSLTGRVLRWLTPRLNFPAEAVSRVRAPAS